MKLITMHEKSLRGKFAKGGEAGFDDSDTTMLMYHEEKGNFMIPKNQIYLWLYEGKGINEKLQSEEYDYVFYPLASQNMAWRSDYVPPLKKIWTKKFQKTNKGSDKLLGVIKAYLLNDGKELYIDMMSTNPTKIKSGIMSYMIQDLRNTFNLTQDQITFSKLTPEGEKFVAKKTYADGGGVENSDIDSSILAKFNQYEEEIIDILYRRHLLHSTSEREIFNDSKDFDNNIDRIAETIEQISITNNENLVSKKIKSFSQTEGGDRKTVIDFDYDDFTEDEMDSYETEAHSEIHEEKEKINEIIENYLQELDDIWDFNKLSEQTPINHWKKSPFKPTGFLRSRLMRYGGDVPHEDKMFQLPLEMVIYVPSTQDVDKVISVDKMDKRVDEVKEYLASKFGGYTSSDKLGGYVDSNGNLVNEDVVQITSFSTKEAFEENKKELIQQIAKWGKDWGQEAIGFEFEGDLMYVPQEL